MIFFLPQMTQITADFFSVGFSLLRRFRRFTQIFKCCRNKNLRKSAKSAGEEKNLREKKTVILIEKIQI